LRYICYYLVVTRALLVVANFREFTYYEIG
jgi:hypothetical protein